MKKIERLQYPHDMYFPPSTLLIRRKVEEIIDVVNVLVEKINIIKEQDYERERVVNDLVEKINIIKEQDYERER